MDNPPSLATIMETAAARPAAALVRLFLCLRTDGHLLEDAVHACHGKASFAIARDTVLASLRDGEPPPEGVGEGAWLHALAALDALLAERRRGDDGLAHRVVTEAGESWLVARPSGWNSRLAGAQPSQLVYWLRHHWVLPRKVGAWSVNVRRDDAVWETLRAAAPGGLRIWAGGFADGVEPDWSDGTGQARALKGAPRRDETIAAAFQAAQAAGAHVLLLPELTVTPAQRTAAADLLCDLPGLLLAIPGSFHEDVNGRNRNVAHLFDGTGRSVLHQHKLLAMRTLGPSGDLVEDIRSGDTIELLETPYGLLALAICRDFCEEAEPGSRIWPQLAPGLVLVPSMSPASTYSAHDRKAATLAREHGTRTAVAIQPEEPTGWKEGVRYTLGHGPKGKWAPEPATSGEVHGAVVDLWAAPPKPPTQ